jgi:hypothetical protein
MDPLDSIDARHQMWRPGKPTCSVLSCGRVANAGCLTDLCSAHAVEVQRFRAWLLRDLDDDLAALRATPRNDVE